MSSDDELKRNIANWMRGCVRPHDGQQHLEWVAERVISFVRAHDRDGERLREAIAYAGGCFAAAETEGWSDALADGDIERICDLWNRRLSFALEALRTE